MLCPSAFATVGRKTQDARHKAQGPTKTEQPIKQQSANNTKIVGLVSSMARFSLWHGLVEDRRR
jgi:hypothetical protein